jgi:hypothetical protein
MNGGLTDQVCDDFTVTSRPELVAVGKELLPDGPVVVDLAVYGFLKNDRSSVIH